jgi:acetyl esterase/lipase
MHLSELVTRTDLWLLVTSIFVAFTARNAYRPFRPTVSLGTVCFFIGWLTSELAVHHVVIQALFVGCLVYEGALEHAPGFLGLAIYAVSWGALLRLHNRGHLALEATRKAFAEGNVPNESLLRPNVRLVEAARPFTFGHPDVVRVRNVLHHQGEGYALRADVFHRKDLPQNAPVVVYVHGGGWIVGFKRYQGLPLMHRLAAEGFVCVSIDYRLSPVATFPDHLIDVKRGIAWAKKNAAQYGGDPGFVAVCGNSAGAHLAALAALTWDNAALQPGFEDDDTRVDACVALYGVYDVTNRFKHWPGQGLLPFWENVIAKKKRATHPEVFSLASPIDQIRPDAPPFFLMHGTRDSLVPISESRRFAKALRETSKAEVLLAEIDDAQHAFEIFHSVRGRYAVQAVACFCDAIAKRAKGSREVASAA